MDNTIIEKAVSEDKNEVMSLYKSMIGTDGCTWHEEYPNEEDFCKDVLSENLFVMRNNQKEIIAAISIDQDDVVASLPVWSGKHSGEIARLAVRADYQNKGIARQMIDYTIRVMRDRGYDYIHYLVSPYNKKALASYEKLAFTLKGKGNLYQQDWLYYEFKL